MNMCNMHQKASTKPAKEKAPKKPRGDPYKGMNLHELFALAATQPDEITEGFALSDFMIKQTERRLKEDEGSGWFAMVFGVVANLRCQTDSCSVIFNLRTLNFSSVCLKLNMAASLDARLNRLPPFGFFNVTSTNETKTEQEAFDESDVLCTGRIDLDHVKTYLRNPNRLEYLRLNLGDEYLSTISQQTLKCACDGSYVDNVDELRELARKIAQLPVFHLVRIGKGTQFAKLIRNFRQGGE